MNSAAERYGVTQSLNVSAKGALTLLLLLFVVIPAALPQAGLDRQRQLKSHTSLAQQYLAEGKPELAIPELRAVIALDPKNVVACGNLGVLLFFRRDYAGAIPQLRVALSIQPDLWKVQALLGISEMRVGEDRAGRNDLATAFPNLQEEKIKIDVGNDLVRSYSSTGDLDKAAEITSAMLRLRPNDAQLLYTAFRVYSDLASQIVLTMAMTEPDSEEIRQATAHQIVMHGIAERVAVHPDSAAGVAELRQSLAENPQLLSTDPNISLSTASELLKLHPQDRDSLISAFRLYASLADQALFRMATYAPSTPEIYQAIAQILAKQGYPTAAIASYQHSLKLSPYDHDLHFELGEMLRSSSAPALQAQAEAEYKLALREDPNDAKAQLRLGEIAEKRGDTKVAYTDYTRAVELQPKDAEAAMELARLLEDMGQPAKALSFMERSVQLDPTNANSHYRLSMLYRDAGRKEDAERELEEYKKYKSLKENLGELLHKLRVRTTPSQPQTSSNADRPSPRASYVGDAACLSCHRSQALSYAATSHHLTSQLPGSHSILGSFTSGSNILNVRDSDPLSPTTGLYFRMVEKEGHYYETAVTGSGLNVSTRSERIDLVVGSGVHGQSYLYWQSNQLYELPVSYWSDGTQWINSPGYKDGTATFSRPITPRCMECHATYIKPLSSDPQTNRYLKGSLVVGISCETCHGPGVDHVTEEKAPFNASTESTVNTILNPATFSRDRQIDLCALCHNGTQREENAPAFSYEPGTPLDQYLTPFPSNAVPPLDVHGDEVGLLKRSRCYLSSPGMTCSTCHDIHAPERPADSYSDRCLVCHRWESCGLSKKVGRKVVDKCIECHMPEQRSTLIVSETAHSVVRAEIRNHWIKVYPLGKTSEATTSSN